VIAVCKFWSVLLYGVELVERGRMKENFRVVAAKVSTWAGSAPVFIGAVLVIIVWAVSGPLFNFSDTWQLVINTSTTIVTFIMVFLIQNTQNRDARAMQLKLDELIRSDKMARDTFVSLEDISDDDLFEIANEFKKLHASSAPTAAMRKLHKKIELEHAKRLSIRGAAQQVVGVILNPLGTNHTETNTKDHTTPTS
jgi:low affinity Fe/Cu permease